MMRAIIAFGVLLIGGVIASGTATAQQAPATASVWVNELGSKMTISSISSQGLISGTYITAVGCGAGKSRPLTGWYNQGAITFTVNFQECNSATSWTGNVAASGTTIVTLWQLTVSGTPSWNSIFANADTFKLAQ